MPYADLAAVRTIANLPAEGEEPTTDARLTALNTALSLLFEEKVGRTWPGEASVARTEAVLAPVGVAPLVLPAPGIWSLVSVTIDAEWDGTAWDGGTVLGIDEVAPIWPNDDGIYLGLGLASGWYWSGSLGYGSSMVLVTAFWADVPPSGADGSAPPDVVEALTFLVAEEYKQEQASPESLIGPDGLAVRTRNPWRFERVTGTIARHRVPERVVV